jgi:hypothetical protein
MKNLFIVGIAIVLAITNLGIVVWPPIQKSVVAQSNSLADDEQATATLATSTKDNPTTFPTAIDQDKIEQLVFNPEISVTNKNLTAVAREVNLAPQNPSVTICSDLPTLADWLPIFSVKLNRPRSSRDADFRA